ncbi:uncharacterized protein NPIL_537761 [Nephila pilipes]|uniref:DUF7041 domain-containing protein n=1 Tax=Nephila pilipes TaxID=299642 RepID=A0A8X6URN5_NEPPI|nr:uncharacterized protein NPIL_537761 [Nephila pilipes]
MPNETSDNSQIARVTVKPPPFWKHNPTLRFVRIEAQFDLAKISLYTTKFNYELSAIGSDILNSVSDLVLKPPENGKYEVLKKRLIKVHSESVASKIRTLLQGLELGDQRPSQLLTRMRSLTSVTISTFKIAVVRTFAEWNANNFCCSQRELRSVCYCC